MACFIVPAAEAVISTIVEKQLKKSEGEPQAVQVVSEEAGIETVERIPFSRKIHWLSNMLWGGSGLLAFEHVWHGEVVPWVPFLSAAGNAADRLEMLREMATVGVTMGVVVTGVWLGIVAVTSAMEKKVLLQAAKR